MNYNIIGFLKFINLIVNDTINNIPKGESVAVNTGLFLGLGRVDIMIKAKDVEESVTGKQIIFFCLINK